MAHIPAYYHNFQPNHPNPNSICVACGCLCLTQHHTYTCTACNVYVHVHCLMGPLSKPVPLCTRPSAASATSWNSAPTVPSLVPTAPSWNSPAPLTPMSTSPVPLAPPALSAPRWTHPTHFGYHPQQPAHGMPPYGPYNHQGYTQNTGNNGSTGMKYLFNFVAGIGVRLISSSVFSSYDFGLPDFNQISDLDLPGFDPFGGC